MTTARMICRKRSRKTSLSPKTTHSGIWDSYLFRILFIIVCIVILYVIILRLVNLGFLNAELLVYYRYVCVGAVTLPICLHIYLSISLGRCENCGASMSLVETGRIKCEGRDELWENECKECKKIQYVLHSPNSSGGGGGDGG